MSDSPHAPFGEHTIEGAFLDDVEYAFDTGAEVTVRGDGASAQAIGGCNLELEREKIGIKVLNGAQHPIIEVKYKLTVPVELSVADGSDVTVDGYEATWTFEDVEVRSVEDESTTILTKHIGRSFGATSDPYE